MKTTKKINPRVQAKVCLEVDTLAKQYLELNRSTKLLGESLDKKKDLIKQYGQDNGALNAETGACVAVGNEYQIGYQIVKRSGGIDLAKVRADASVWKQCLTPQFDPAKLEALFKENKITKKQFLSFFAPDGESKRIVVEPVGGKAKSDDAARYES
jgi:hypothetical protein